MGLGEVVAKILATGSPCHRVVTESDAVSYPEIPHIDRLRALESYSAACNTLRAWREASLPSGVSMFGSIARP